MSFPTPLTLHLKSEYFDQVKSGGKTEEYREIKPYWIKRLEGKTFTRIELWRGYPKFSKKCPDNYIVFPWNGFYEKVIEHPMFNSGWRTTVYAIPLNPEGIICWWNRGWV